MRARGLSIIVLPLLVAAACGGGGDSGGGDDMQGSADAAVDAVSGAAVSGSIRRTATPMGDAKGSLYIAIFDQDPVIDRDTAQVVARAVVDNVDLSPPNATVSYSLTGVPPRADHYFFVAFLDDNGNVDISDPTKAGPDRGDLVSLDGLAAPTVTVATSAAVTYDAVLNTALPF